MSQLMKYHRNNLSPSSGRGLWCYLAIHLGYPHWLGLSDLMMPSLAWRRRNESVRLVCVKLRRGAILLMPWQRWRFRLVFSYFTGTNMPKRTNRWLVYMLLICFIMHPESILQLIYDWSWYVCLHFYACLCVMFFSWFSWKLSTVGERGSFAFLNDHFMCKAKQ